MDLTILGIVVSVIGIFVGIGAYFVVNRKNVIKHNNVNGDLIMGDKIDVKGDYTKGDKTVIGEDATKKEK